MSASRMHQPGVPGTVKELLPRIVEREDLRDQLRALGIDGECFTLGECRIILAYEPPGWHLSISCEDRYPTWDEIKTARYRLVPDDVTMAMILPPPGQYTNVEDQDNVFHLWQTPGEET